jgi:1-acyl-sn-glycerol-3-phosphate acyltransferase
MSFVEDCAAGAVRRFVRLALGIYFRRIERFDTGQVPETGPVLFASNHPGSLTDAFLIGTVLKRRIGFVGTVQLFRWRPIAWLLKACGIIPVNRVKDDPRAMRTVLETFEACYRVLEAGGAVGIFPEGVTYNDTLMRPVKSGTARMALELEQRHEGKLGLRIVPVGISYSGKERYRSEVLIRFGEPILVSAWLGDGTANRKAAIHRLNDEIVGRIRGLILQLPELTLTRLVKAVACLYSEQLRAEEGRSWTQAEELARLQRIANLVEHFQRNDPDRVRAFLERLGRYRRHLNRLGLSDPTTQWKDIGGLEEAGLRPGSFVLALMGLPFAVYGWIHRLPPALVVEWAVRRFTVKGARKAQTPHVSLVAGVVGFGVAYVVYGVMGYWVLGWPLFLLYVLSLPLAGLFAHSYVHRVKRLPLWFKWLWLRYRSPWVSWRIQRERERLIQEIESARSDAVVAD